MEVNGQRKARRKDYISREDNNANCLNDFGEFDPWTAWAYKPRTISLLLIGTCLLVWASGALDPESTASDDVVTSVKRGVWAMIAVFLAYSLLQAPSTVLIRPHPAIWRLVHGMAVVYLVALTFLLFQNRDDARQLMKYLHPDLGVELPERSYGTDCRIYVPENPKSRFNNVYETLFDEFVPAHIFGWWGKAIMIRNQPLLWVLSIGFELMELTFRHMLPNFNECWWDSIILDILICNWFGIWAGMRSVRYFDGKTYEWVGISRQPNIIGKKACEEGRGILLAFPSNMHSGASYLYQVWPWSLSQPNAPMADNFLDMCGFGPPDLPACLVLANSSGNDEKKNILKGRLELYCHD
ncbi:CDP-diacylglycerol--serine O-phosphatidyltransferase 1 isoform X5 [Phoenix dactylifera]|uniref:CDP-diacylglycerol--serine O-phosphatidyltransferase n=1 Tax=Phoenix dactylifera TaxID=42345 RepID=A0A8B8J0J4_PHODC|nr:CDP-diacylglycerol--serine O-phosphatidyltransferase 1 isoform X5 [Phoenix dactylifera]